MKQAWNELCSSQDNSPLSFKFSELKSSEICPNSGDLVDSVGYGSQNSRICSFSTRLWNNFRLSQMTSRIQRMCLKSCSMLMKSSVDSVSISKQAIRCTGSFLLLSGQVFTSTIRTPAQLAPWWWEPHRSPLYPQLWVHVDDAICLATLWTPFLALWSVSKLRALQQKQRSSQEERVGFGASQVQFEI